MYIYYQSGYYGFWNIIFFLKNMLIFANPDPLEVMALWLYSD